MKALPRSGFIRLPAVLLLLLPALAPAQVIYDLNFTATGINMWGGGSANTVNFSAYYGVNWNTSGSVGGIEHTIFGTWGAEAFGSTSGRVGVDIGFSSTSGSVNINLPYRVTVTPSAADMSSAGSYTLNVASALNVAPGQSIVTTHFSNAQVTVGGDLAAKVTLGGEIAAYNSVRGSTTLFDFDAGKFPIFSYNQNGNNQLSVFGGAGIPVGTGITVGLPTDNQRPEYGSAQGQSIFSGLPVGVTLGTLTVASPSNALNGASGGSLSAHGSQPTLIALQADILGIASALAGLPVNPLDLRADLFGISFTGKIASATVGVAAGLDQNVTLNQSLAMKLRSAVPLTYHLGDGTTVTTSELVVTNLNTTLTFDKPAGNVAIFPEFYLISPEIRNQLTLTLGIAFSVDALAFSASKYGVSLGSLGPLYHLSGVLPVTGATVYDDTFDVSQLGYHIFGGSINGVQPTVGNVAAGQVVQFYNRSGLFATSSINGTLDVGQGSAYINSGALTVGAGGALAVQSTSTGAASTFVTAGLTNQGVVYVGAGSTLEISGGASGFGNLSGGTLTGGTYMIEGTLRIPNASITTNAANLYLTGGTLDTLAGGNSFAALNRNAAGANLNVYQNLGFTSAFTNQGSLIAHAPLVTMPSLTNASTATASVTSGVLRIGSDEAHGTLTNNGVLNVLGGNLQVFGNLGNLTGTSTGTLTGGTWNLSNTLTYGLSDNSALPGIDIIAAGTTINLFYGGRIERGYYVNSSASAVSGLYALDQNRGTLRLIGGELGLMQGLTNTGTILITPDSAGHAGQLGLSGAFNNSAGTIQIDAGAKLKTTQSDYYTGPLAWTNVSAGGTLSNIGNVTLGGTIEYIGPKITSLVGDLTLVGTTWRFDRVFGTNLDQHESGLALTQVQGALRLRNGASFATQPAGTFTLNGGALDLALGTTFAVDRGRMIIQGSPTLTNNGSLKLLHTGTTPATLELSSNVTFGGNGSLQLSNLATNEILSSGGTLTNSSLHVIAGAGKISAPVVNEGTIQSLGTAGLTLTGALSNTGLILAHGESTSLDFSTYVYTPSPLTLLGNTIYNANGDILAASRLIANGATVIGGTLGALSGGRLQLSNATLNSVALTNAEGGTIEILPNTTSTFTDTASAPGSLTNNAGATFEIGSSGRLKLLTATPFVNRGTLLLGSDAMITEQTIGYVTGNARFQNYGRIQFSAANTMGTLYADVANYATGVMDFSDGNTLRLIGQTFQNEGRILLGNAGTTGTLLFSYITDLTGGGSIQLGGLVKTTTGGVDTFHWENSGVIRGAGLLTNVNNTIAGAGTIGTGDLTFVNGPNGIIHASSPGGTLTVHAGIGGFFNSKTGFTNQGLMKVDAGATLEVLSSPGVFNSLTDGSLDRGRYEVAGTLRVPSFGIATNYADLTVTGAGRIENPFHSDVLASLEANLGTLRLNGGATLALNQTLDNWRDIVLGGTGALAGGTLTTRALFGPEAATLILADPSAQLRLTGATNDYGFGGVISGSGSVTRSGFGRQIFNGANTYTGGTTISGGTLLVGHTSALGTGTVTLSGGALASEVVGLSLANPVFLTGNSQIVTGTGGVNTGDLTLTGVISGTAGSQLTKSGTGTLTLAGANTYIGITSITRGTVVPASDSAFGTSTIYFGEATLRGDASARTLANPIQLVGQHSDLVNSAALTLSGPIYGSAIFFSKSGTGTLTLSGANSFGGTFVLSQGTLVIGHDSALGISSFTFGNATLQTNANRTVANSVALSGNGTITGANDLTLTGVLYGSGSLLKTGTGTLTLSGAYNSQSGAVRLEAGTLALGHEAALGTSTLTLAGGTFLPTGNVGNPLVLETDVSFGTANALTFSGAISGGSAHTLTKTGSGALTLSGDNTYTGGTLLSAGSLVVGSNTAFGTGTVVLAGSTLQGSGTFSLANAFTLNVDTTFADTGALTLSGVITGAKQITKSGTGTLALTATNLFTGGVSVTGGALEFGSFANFGSGQVTLNGGGLRWKTGTTTDVSLRLSALGANGGTFDTNGNNVTLASAVSGSGALTKTGAGTLTLAAANTYAGSTTISQGTLRIGTGGTGGSIAGNILNHGALIFDRSDALTFSDVISGTGSLTKSGTNTLTLTSNHTFTGTTTIAGGTLKLGTGGTTGSLAGPVINNGTLAIDRSGTSTFDSAISGTGSLTKSGTGTVVLSADNTYTGATTISGGTLQLGAGGSTGSIAGSILNNATLAFDRSGSLTVGSAISGTGAVTKTGPGSLTLSAANTYAGGTMLSQGTLVAAHNTALGSGTVTLTDASVSLLIAGNATRTIANPIAVTFGAYPATLGSTGSGSFVTYSGNVSLDRETTLYDSTGNRTTFDGNISGFVGLLTIDGINGGRVTTSGTHSFWGDVLIKDGVTFQLTSLGNQVLPLGTNVSTGTSGQLWIVGANTVGSLTGGAASTVQVATGGVAASTLSVGANDTSTTFAGTMKNGVGGSGALSLTKIGAGTLTLTGANTYTGVTTINAGTLQLGDGGATGSLASNVVNHATLAFNRSDASTFGAVISSTGTVVKLGAGALTLTGANTYAGNTTLRSGTLIASHATAFGTGTVVLDGGTLASTLPTLGNALALNTSSTVQAASALTLSGVITGGASAALTKTGNGTLTLAGDNTYAGGTIVTAGTLAVSGATALGTGPLTLDGGALAVSGSTSTFNNDIVLARPSQLGETGDITLNGVVSGGNTSLTKVGTGKLTLANANTYTGGTIVNAGTLVLATSERLADTGALTIDGGTLSLGTSSETVGAFTLKSGAVTAFTDGGTGNLSAASFDVQSGTLGARLIGSGALTKSGSGTATLTNYNAYTGGTTIAGGTLAIANDYLGDFFQPVTFSGGTLRITEDLYMNRPITLNASGTIETDAAISLGRTISGAGTLIKSGTGSLTLTPLSGANTYSGGTIITAGRLTASDLAALGSGSVAISQGAVLDVGAGTLDFSRISGAGAVSSSGTFAFASAGDSTLAISLAGTASLTKSGAGTLTLPGNNSYSGGTTLSAGTITVTGNNALGTGAVTMAGGTLNFTGATSLPNDIALATPVTFNGTYDLTLTGALTGTAAITKSGPGTLVLAGNNAHSGSTTLSGGTLTVRHANALQNSPVILNGGALNFATITAATFGGLAGSTDLALSNTSAAPVALTVAIAGNSTYSGLLSGNGSLTKAGTGTLTLPRANTFGGGTTINAGTLALGHSSALGTGAVEVKNGGTLALNVAAATFTALTGAGTVQLGTDPNNRTQTLTFVPSDNASFAGVIAGYGTVVVAGTGSQTLTNAQLFRGPVHVDGGTLIVAAESALGADVTEALSFNGGTLRTTASVGLSYRSSLRLEAGGGTFSQDAGTTFVFGSPLTGPGRLTKTGDGTLALAGNNTYTGGTTILAGRLQFAGAVSLLGDIINHGQIYTTINGLVLPHSISGTGTLLKGPGSLTLTGENTYTGLTTIQGGVLNVGNGGTTGSIVGNVVFTGPTGTLRFNRSDDLTYGGIISTPGGSLNISTGEIIPQSGNLSKRGTGTLTLTGANTFNGNTTIEAGVLAISADTALGSAPATTTAGRLVLNGGALATTASFTLNASRGATLGVNGGTFAPAASTTLTYGGIIAGTGALTKTGAGTLVLTGTSTYSGNTTISAGRLELNGSAAASAFTVNGGILGGNGTVGALALASGGTLSPGNSAGTILAGATTFLEGGRYQWEINDGTGVAGTNWDRLNVTGLLTISATSASPFAITLASLTPANLPGDVINFNFNTSHAYTIATASSGITGFSADKFTLNTAGFTNHETGTWSLIQNGNNLDLLYTASAIPEPSTYAALAGLATLALALLRRRPQI